MFIHMGVFQIKPDIVQSTENNYKRYLNDRTKKKNKHIWNTVIRNHKKTQVYFFVNSDKRDINVFTFCFTFYHLATVRIRFRTLIFIWMDSESLYTDIYW